MDKPALISALKTYIQDKILEGDAGDLDEATPLLELGILDSFSIVEVLSFIESEFGVEVNLAAVTPEKFSDLNGIADLVIATHGAGS
jgi:clorobiocin biosynthesis protein CloN5